MLNGIHFLLTYSCKFECDHCFLYCSPRSTGTFTIGQVREVLEEARAMGTVEWIYFEGGEPFLYFPLLVESIREARARGFQVGVVTSGYGALSEEDAELWLRPLAAAGLTYLSVSNDMYHYGEDTENPAATASAIATRLGIDTSPICIEPPKVTVPCADADADADHDGKGEPVVGGGAMFRGRAADLLTKDLPRRPWDELGTCPHEELETPNRVHVDPQGNVHICQGISIGNLWDRPLREIAASYRAAAHPICAPLVAGGPAELAKRLSIPHEAGYVDECHFCYSARKTIIDRFPDQLTPRQVYGLEEPSPA